MSAARKMKSKLTLRRPKSRPSTPTSQRWVDVLQLDSLAGRPRPLRRHLSARRVKKRGWNRCFALLEDGRLTLTPCRRAPAAEFNLDSVALQKNEKRCQLRLLVGGSTTDGQEVKVPTDEFDAWLDGLRAHQLWRRRQVGTDAEPQSVAPQPGAAKPALPDLPAAAAKFKTAEAKVSFAQTAVGLLAPKRNEQCSDVKQQLTQQRIESSLGRLETLDMFFQEAFDSLADSLAAQRALPEFTPPKVETPTPPVPTPTPTPPVSKKQKRPSRKRRRRSAPTPPPQPPPPPPPPADDSDSADSDTEDSDDQNGDHWTMAKSEIEVKRGSRTTRH